MAEDLAAVGLADPCGLLYTFLAAEDDLSAYLGAGPLNTDDRPVLSYSTYGASFLPTAAGNLVRLLACRGDVARFVKHPASAETMLRHYAASNQAFWATPPGWWEPSRRPSSSTYREPSSCPATGPSGTWWACSTGECIPQSLPERGIKDRFPQGASLRLKG